MEWYLLIIADEMTNGLLHRCALPYYSLWRFEMIAWVVCDFSKVLSRKFATIVHLPKPDGIGAGTLSSHVT